MTRITRSGRVVLAAALTVVLVLAIATLAGAAPPLGKGKPPGPGKSAAEKAKKKQNGPAARQYGQPKVTLCHKGKTITVGAPAARAHLRHGDRLGPC